jgi:PqqD family protein of HPr-rel-A system
MHWRVARGVRFEVRHFGDESVLFDPRSGLTHFLNGAAVEALELLSQRALSNEELTSCLLERCEVTSVAEFTQDVAALIDQLARLDFIELIPHENC